MKKNKPCTLGPKHKWVWKRNVTLKRIYVMPRGTTAQLSYRGEYRCECGERKYGVSKDRAPEDLAASAA
ncbi:hypothetical protein [Burkholderia vietnamiensis]|uniref:hypothetical protein n=1 Tax=Burkholderia vietnamiensis TaxID=60552 RepID=UPI000A821514|nr:hypothetical protein [Burkholderia vietnamiensis]